MSEAEDVQFKEMFPLVIGLLAGLAVFFVVIAQLIASDSQSTYVPPGMTAEEAVSSRVQPIGQVNMGGPIVAEADTGGGGGSAAAGGGEPQSGEQVYNSVCMACHDSGVAGAPKIGDNSIWQSRVEERGGYDPIYENALNGYKGMPAKGGASISEEELDRAVKYLLEESGVSL
ncbi:MAG: c-type cytochrome [Halofilum sp. (in: g-proteobacteria)]|nr:c-type cytochrome [Halofilum sp. (in: g-proteobacteria)]